MASSLDRHRSAMGNAAGQLCAHGRCRHKASAGGARQEHEHRHRQAARTGPAGAIRERGAAVLNFTESAFCSSGPLDQEKAALLALKPTLESGVSPEQEKRLVLLKLAERKLGGLRLTPLG